MIRLAEKSFIAYNTLHESDGIFAKSHLYDRVKNWLHFS